MTPHERSLVTRLKDKPFALLGISCDQDKNALKRVIAEDKITWRNWWDGLDGHISAEWNVDLLPSIYILDADGIIRFAAEDYNGSPEVIDAAVDTLLAEKH